MWCHSNHILRVACSVHVMRSLALPHKWRPLQTQVQDGCATAAGPVAGVIARMTAEAAALAHAERTQIQEACDRCAATSRLMRSAGKVEQADLMLAAAPALPHTAAQHMRGVGGVVTLRPPTMASCAPTLSGPCPAAPLTWDGSVVAASALLPPIPGSWLHPHPSPGHRGRWRWKA